ncbi:hypothetical protein TUM12370_28340 [Salmonella enterica subsp. enterica serovar Choleraesuis]|nr:hypothetical protein TUM12370_28340 [Salmonella enterica subsp. enterica serovar Choleraesuis]
MNMWYSFRPRICGVAFSLALAFLLAFTSFATLAQPTDLPSKSDIENQLASIQKQKNPSPQDKLVEQDLNQTLEVLAKIDNLKQDALQLNQQINQAPEKMRQATEGLNALNQPVSDDELRQSYSGLTLRQLESKVSSILDDLQTAQNDLSTYNSQLVVLQTQPERVQNNMFQASEQLQQIRSRLSTTDVGDNALRPSQQTLLLAQQVFLNAQLEQQRNSLSSNTTLQDTLQKQRDYTSANITHLEHQLQVLQTVANGKRLTITEKTAQEAITPDDKAATIQDHPLVKQELEVNHQLSERLINVTENNNNLVQQNIKVKTWLDRASQSEGNLKEQISVLKGSLLLSRILYQQQQTLPSADELEDMTNRIADLRLEQFNINQQRDALFQNDNYVSQLEANYHGQVSDDVDDALLQIVDMRRELLDQLNKQLGNQLMMAINLQINQQQLMSVSTSLRKLLTQQIFWVNSNKPMNWEWIKSYPQALTEQIRGYKIGVNLHHLLTELPWALFSGVPLLLLAGLLRWRYRWLLDYKTQLSTAVGNLRKDSQLHTPKALFIDVLRALPVCLTLLAIGLIIYNLHLGISELLWSFSKQLMWFWLVFGVCWRVLEKDGVAERHFGMSESQASHWRRQIVRISLALLPLLFWTVVGENSPLHLMEDVFGQSMIFLNLLVIAALVWPICRDSWQDKESRAPRLITITILFLVPIALLVLTALGYFYTTLRLSTRCIETVYLVLIWNLLHRCVMRGLSVAARRIAWRRAVARRENLVKEGAEGSEPENEEPMAIDQVNQQTLRITMLGMFALFAGVFWAIWSDLITVFAYLDSIALWHYSGTEAGAAVVKSVTLGSLLYAVVALVVSWALIRNLPGLLEVLVLSRLKMRQGSSYAITTILNYVIIAVGAMMVFGSLGVSWDKLQWLAAALSVGLGFGLQEIFGNFVSGIIILFERPVRIGDTVTIGSYSGTVSKIRIRATTITDFDRKEIIIPNKAFVTERLINWSLSDTITRLVINLGVAYGSDLDKVHDVLLQAAHEHPKVMQDPPPNVFFMSFGASTLDHELRLYVRELRDRSYTVDELNRRIDQLCRENGIDIAFNQLEVHLHNDKGDEVTEVKRPLGDDGSVAPSV